MQNVRPIAQEPGLEVVLPLPLKADAKPEDCDPMVGPMPSGRPDMVLDHGSPGPHQPLITKAVQPT